MGSEYKTRLKEQYGKSAVVAYDVIRVAGTFAPAALADQVMTGDGVSQYRVDRPAKLDGLSINLSPRLVAASGTLDVQVVVDGVVQGSGVVAAGQEHADVMFTTEADNEVRLTEDQVLTLRLQKGATPSGVSVVARAHLRLFEK